VCELGELDDIKGGREPLRKCNPRRQRLRNTRGTQQFGLGVELCGRSTGEQRRAHVDELLHSRAVPSDAGPELEGTHALYEPTSGALDLAPHGEEHRVLGGGRNHEIESIDGVPYLLGVEDVARDNVRARDPGRRPGSRSGWVGRA
jgi:hypothetical protein